jgi:hypothetical protein
MYCYAIGERSSRRIERRCIEDVAVRVVCANQVPDHTTIARFRQRHERALADLFGQVLGFCAQAGLVGIEVLAIDGTKIHANASQHANVDYDQLAKKILEEAAEADAAEDEQFGDRRGDGLRSNPSNAPSTLPERPVMLKFGAPGVSEPDHGGICASGAWSTVGGPWPIVGAGCHAPAGVVADARAAPGRCDSTSRAAWLETTAPDPPTRSPR